MLFGDWKKIICGQLKGGKKRVYLTKIPDVMSSISEGHLCYNCSVSHWNMFIANCDTKLCYFNSFTTTEIFTIFSHHYSHVIILDNGEYRHFQFHSALYST